MIRKDREITDRTAIIDIMRRCHVCRLAFNDKDSGFPYIVPMNFGLIEGEGNVTLCFHCAKRGRKLELIALDPRVTFEMECDVELVYNPAHRHNTDIFKSVIGNGKALIVEDPTVKKTLLQALVDRYHETPITVSDKDANRCVIFKIEVCALWGKEKELPQ